MATQEKIEKKIELVNTILTIEEQNELAECIRKLNQRGANEAATWIDELKKEAVIASHKKELDKAIELLLSLDDTEPTHFKGFAVKFVDVEPDYEAKLARDYLLDMEKKIAEHFGMSEAWVHISINGEFLCST